MTDDTCVTLWVVVLPVCLYLLAYFIEHIMEQ